MANIAVLLKGGLGNQLFQYAFAREMQQRGHRVSLDDSAVLASGMGVKIAGLSRGRLPISSASSFGRRTLDRVRVPFTASGRHVVVEESLRFDSRVLVKPPRRGLLDGYWQSEQYFTGVADQMREEIGDFCASLLRDEGRRLLRVIHSAPRAVSVHVRRGDYAADPKVTAIHGLLPLEYYTRSMEEASKDGPTQFFVFSDEPLWAAEHLRGPNVAIVPHNVAYGAAGEIYLMSQCDDHVIANSSFSWWGAWLNARDHRVVYAPARWFAADYLNSADLLPSSWRLVSS